MEKESELKSLAPFLILVIGEQKGDWKKRLIYTFAEEGSK